MAIAHDDDLRFVEGEVYSSQSAGIHTRSNLVTRLPRKPLPRI